MLTSALGQARCFANFDLQESRHQLPAKDEDVESCVLGDPEEGRRFPIHATSARRREAGSNGCPGGRHSRCVILGNGQGFELICFDQVC